MGNKCSSPLPEAVENLLALHSLSVTELCDNMAYMFPEAEGINSYRRRIVHLRFSIHQWMNEIDMWERLYGK